ncbi:uncharacterized protein LOC134219334 [Armigeres subalbatus]|uniref:uncharacterized protein LOC134219334 n=1 Tax=Armigeres subalbatus TaxID=124917 RepID=UPI002ED6800D
MQRSLPTLPTDPRPTAPPPQQILNYTIASDIQFSSDRTTTMNGNACSPFLLHSQHEQQQYLSYPLFEGPFQIIEPGSDLYDEMESDFGGSAMALEDLFISENGIPQDVLEDVFRMDDDIEAVGRTLPNQYPVAKGLSLDEYEKELVAEMEKMFPREALTPPAAPVPLLKSRLMEELVRNDLPENPYYMNVQLRSGGPRNEQKMDIIQRDSQRGLRRVEMTDSNGISFKANYYHRQRIGNQLKSAPPINTALQHRRVAELLQSPPLRNLSPAMASKIESLTSGNRNVTITPVRQPPPLSPVTPRNISPSSSVFTKNPRRTVVNSTPVEPVAPPPPTPIDFPFPMAMVKQEPPDEIDSTPIEVPVIVPTAITNKQPRKQNLQSLSQCDMELEKANTDHVIPLPIAMGGSGHRDLSVVRKTMQRPPPNDFVTVTIKDANNNADSKHDNESSAPIRSTTPRATLVASIPPSNQALPTAGRYPFKKRSLVTHYRVQMQPNQKRISGQPLETIEILDSSEDEEGTNGSSTGTATAPESETEDIPKPKLPGNTESIQCPFCCKVFFSSHLLMLHGQNCADAMLFDNTPTTQKQTPDNVSKRSSNRGKSLLKPATETGAKSTEKQDPPITGPKQKTSAESKPKRPPIPRSSMRLSIEILPSAFSIDNLLLCEVCKKTFRSQEHLDVHQKIHKTPTVCNYCKKKFYETPRKHYCQEMKRSKQRK